MNDVNSQLLDALHQRNVLMKAIFDAAVAMGIADPNGVPTGPNLLDFCQIFAEDSKRKDELIAELRFQATGDVDG